MESCRLRLLGPPEVTLNESAIHIKLRKAIALLAFLAVEDRHFSREYLASLLWPTLNHDRGLANLRRILTVLRETFSNGFIVTEGDTVALDRTFLEVDVDQFRELAGKGNVRSDPARLARATELYRSDFLDGFTLGNCEEYHDWQTSIRARLESELDTSFQTLVRLLVDSDSPGEALPVARRWLERDQTNEAAHRALMEIYARLGRPDMARRQFERCLQALRAAGIEPDEETLDLRAEISSQGPVSADPESGRDHSPGRGGDRRSTREGKPVWARPRLLKLAGLVLLAVAALVIGITGIVTPSDMMITGLEVIRTGEQLRGLRITFHNAGNGRRRADFSVSFSGNPVIGAERTFQVYSDAIRVRWNNDRVVYLDANSQIQWFVSDHDVRIPPGTYRAAVVLDPRARPRGHSESNNYLYSNETFSFAGAEAVETIGLEIDEIETEGDAKSELLEVTVTPFARPADTDNSARFTVTPPGRFSLPLDGLRAEDGQYAVLITRAADRVSDQSPGVTLPLMDLIADRIPANLVFAGIHFAGGAPIRAGETVQINFVRPPPPRPDVFEPDDEPLTAPMMDPSGAPVRQYRSFVGHDGEMDQDWVRIFLAVGDRLRVETSNALGHWQPDTAVDIADSEMNYITSGEGKPGERNYSLLDFVNATGRDQVFHVLVKPYNQYSYDIDGTAEYVVEYRVWR